MTKRLVETENLGAGLISRYWRHLGDDNREKITVETSEDVEPQFEIVKSIAQAQKHSRSSFRLKAVIPTTILDRATQIAALTWGISRREAFSELMQTRTDRSKRSSSSLTISTAAG